MTDVEGTYEDFIASRRSGRRNAIHEIQAVPGVEGSSELSEGLAQLSISQSGDEGEDTEKSQDSAAKEKKAQADGN